MEGLPFVGVRRRWKFPFDGVRRREKRESDNPDPLPPQKKPPIQIQLALSCISSSGVPASGVSFGVLNAYLLSRWWK